jgi:hypothetical protein
MFVGDNSVLQQEEHLLETVGRNAVPTYLQWV